jgi:hypothetical protein
MFKISVIFINDHILYIYFYIQLATDDGPSTYITETNKHRIFTDTKQWDSNKYATFVTVAITVQGTQYY